METKPICRGQEPREIPEADYKNLIKYPDVNGWEEVEQFEVADGSPFPRACREVRDRDTGDIFYVVHPPKKRNSLAINLEGESDTNTDTYRLGGDINLYMRPHPMFSYLGSLEGQVDAGNDVRELQTTHQEWLNLPNEWLSFGAIEYYGHVPNEGYTHQARVVSGPLFYVNQGSWFEKGNQDPKNHLYFSQFFGYEYSDPEPPEDSVDDLPQVLLPISSSRIQFAKKFGGIETKVSVQLVQDLATDYSLPNPINNTEVDGYAALGLTAKQFGAKWNVQLGYGLNWARERPVDVEPFIEQMTLSGGGEWKF